ncbi:HSPB1-associated protein 1 isoform X2 [Cricetulus griseus]|uniref:HSPB1-associated protein 1 isoform X2 n=1 Tax=Cricetulus griseus TaxID=10029 RepID=UPI0015C3F2DF|nr:HSPB1-associated protein 1 isoform X2 [Cricetulus griseus]
MATDCKGRGPGTPAQRAVGKEGECVKPFTPEKAKEIIMSLQQPAIFCNMVFDWPAQHWTAEHLSRVLQGKQIRFRMGLRSTDTVPQFETACSYVDATLEEFLTWNCDQSSVSGPFKDYDHSKFWAYADYKYFVNLFEDKTNVFQEVMWSDFGFPGRNGQESTLWIGSLGAHTPCHLDSYGCNLVFQVQGRIPYEESSVFSKINVVNPDLERFPQFQKARRHTVTLSPGQVLFVPRHWWHYVESIDPVTVSINSWIELLGRHQLAVNDPRRRSANCKVLPGVAKPAERPAEDLNTPGPGGRAREGGQEEDHLARVEEAITRMLVCALKTAEDPHHPRAWLNPTEVEETSHEVNCCYLNDAVCAFFDHCGKAKEVETQALRANGEKWRKEEPSVQEHMEVEQAHSQSFTVRTGKQEVASQFGPDLVPVTPASEDRPSEKGGILGSDSKGCIDRDKEHSAELSYARRQQASIGASAASEQVTSRCPVAPSPTFVSTDDLLDCLVNPQVTRMVAQLLIQGKSLRF